MPSYIITSDRGDEGEADSLAGALAAARCFVVDDGCETARIDSTIGAWIATGKLDHAGRYLLQTTQGRL